MTYRKRPADSRRVWLCIFRHLPPLYIRATSAGVAKAEAARRAGQVPTGVTAAGYSAEPAKARPKRTAKRAAARDGRPRARARAALRLYGAIRADWPLPGLLAVRRHSDQALRAFIADLGAAILELDRDVVRELDRLVEAEVELWRLRALKLTAKRLGTTADLAELEDRIELKRNTASRLGRRKAVRQALLELDGALAGNLERAGDAVDAFRELLIGHGYTVEEAERFAGTWSRILVPRF